MAGIRIELKSILDFILQSLTINVSVNRQNVQEACAGSLSGRDLKINFIFKNLKESA